MHTRSSALCAPTTGMRGRYIQLKRKKAMKILLPIFLIFTFNLQSQNSDYDEDEKRIEDIRTKVEKVNNCRKWKKRKHIVKEEIKRRVFTEKETCKKRGFKKYSFSKNIIERKKLNRPKFSNETIPETGQYQIDIITYKDELIYVKESYLDSYRKEYFFDRGEYISIRMTYGGKLMLDDVGKEYLDWLKDENEKK